MMIIGIDPGISGSICFFQDLQIGFQLANKDYLDQERFNEKIFIRNRWKKIRS